jgi:hypothetical protein
MDRPMVGDQYSYPVEYSGAVRSSWLNKRKLFDVRS